jgi:hypothetical protein
MHVDRLVLALLVAACAAHAQDVQLDPDWREAQVAPPPAFKPEGLIPLEIPGSALRFGVDPATISVGADRIVRYVVVASSSTGAMNAIYEGLRCNTGEYKVYARHTPSGWSVAKDAQWRSLHEQPISRHSLLIARNGACVGHGTNSPASQIVRDLRSPADRRFGP